MMRILNLKEIRTYRSFLLLLTVILVVGCKHDPDPYVPFVCFESEVLPIFIANCSQAGCHGNGSSEEGYTLDNYNGIMKGVSAFNADKSEHIKQIESGEMPVPPKYPLTSIQIQTIKDWINDGALYSTDCDTGICDTTYITYSNHVTSVMNKYCVGCHRSPLSQSGNGNIDLTTYTNVKNQITLGRFWGSVNFDTGYSPMPKGGNQITSCELSQLKIWLNDGALNN